MIPSENSIRIVVLVRINSNKIIRYHVLIDQVHSAQEHAGKFQYNNDYQEQKCER